MRKPTSRHWFLGLLLLGGATLLARELSAEIPTVKGIGKVQIVAHVLASAPNNEYTNLFVVPDKKVFVLTDLIVTNATTADATVQLFDQVTGDTPVAVLPPVQVGAKSNFDHLFGVGLEFGPGHIARVFPLATGAQQVFVSGYFRKS